MDYKPRFVFCFRLSLLISVPIRSMMVGDKKANGLLNKVTVFENRTIRVEFGPRNMISAGVTYVTIVA